jgi:probable F420-dependent oxidoreductase
MTASASTSDDIGLHGRLGVWLRGGTANGPLAAELERLGYTAVWIGGSPAADLAVAEDLLDATETILIATGVVNIWRSDAREVAASFARITERHPSRFLLGIGAGHPEVAGSAAERPYSAVSRYLDVLDDAGVPLEKRVVAALGPRMLRLAGERSRGAHPFLVTSRHTAEARTTLGPDRLLVPEQRVVLETDASAARERARATLERYLELSNYRNSLLRQGFDESDLDDGGSDRLVDEIAPHGTPEAVAARLRAHVSAGADHVAVQLVPGPGDELAAFAALAAAGKLS